MCTFIFVTGSINKYEEAKRILNVPIERIDIELPEIQAVDIENVVIHKAKYAYEILKPQNVIVEDTGLFIEAWNGLPGALIKWFLKRVETEGICTMLNSFHNRKALAKTVVATYDGKQVQMFNGEVQGEIAISPKGNNGFGWDSIFIPQNTSKTFAEMSSQEKDTLSMRKLAFEKVAAYFELQN